MIQIPIEDVPELPLTDIEHDAKFGIYDDGILIHYVLKDIARLVTWEDIILLGLGEDLENSKIAVEEKDGLKEIPGPVVP
ncbi:MAG: hypothetical protein M0Q91_12865 [Methanoregula sp.]|jgi:hypothetical protein|nr:hypothetical protein [Methanoregula sp.]